MEWLLLGVIGIGLAAVGFVLGWVGCAVFLDKGQAQTSTLWDWVAPLPQIPEVHVRPLCADKIELDDPRILAFDRSKADQDIQRRLRLFARLEQGKNAAGGEDYNPGA